MEITINMSESELIEAVTEWIEKPRTAALRLKVRQHQTRASVSFSATPRDDSRGTEFRAAVACTVADAQENV